jgi:hypothetical protein
MITAITVFVVVVIVSILSTLVACLVAPKSEMFGDPQSPNDSRWHE